MGASPTEREEVINRCIGENCKDEGYNFMEC